MSQDRIPKSEWGDGPWQHEPDLLLWTDPSTRYECMVRRNPATGSLCGYVGVSDLHPAYDLHYDGIPVEEEKKRSEDFRRTLRRRVPPEDFINELGPTPTPIEGIGEKLLEIKVHGGLTFSGRWDEKKHLWWFGFDCGHAWDLSPALEATIKKYGITSSARSDDVYRNFDYVKKECTTLARQLKELEVVTPFTRTNEDHNGPLST